MGSSRAKILLVLALIFALATGWLVYSYLQQQQTRLSRLAAKDRVAAVQVVVAGRALSMGHRLTAEDMATISWPKESALQGAIGKKEGALGKYLRRDVVKGEPILKALLTAEVAAAGGLTNLIEPGRRAITIEVDPVTGVGGFVRPGSHVDVLATLPTASTGISTGMKKLITKVIIQNIKVLAVDQEANPLLRLVEAENVRMAKTVTLLVTPEEAERLTLAGSQGSIHLVMRNIKDDLLASTDGATIEELVPSKKKKAAPVKRSKPRKKVKKSKPKPPPVVRKPAVTEIEVFRGSERKVEEFEEETE